PYHAVGQSRPREWVPGTDLLTNLRAWRGRLVCSADRAMTNNSDIVFPPAARRAQAQRGSPRAYEKRIAAGFPDPLTAALSAFSAELDTAFLATVPSAGAPYTQHRGGPKGFIKVLDEKTLGFADYAENRQYITLSNLAENDRAYLFLLD